MLLRAVVRSARRSRGGRAAATPSWRSLSSHSSVVDDVVDGDVDDVTARTPHDDVPAPIAAAMALARRLEDPADPTLRRSLGLLRPSWNLDADGRSGLKPEELHRARELLQQLADGLEREPWATVAATGATESPLERQRRLQKTLTGRLDRLLRELRGKQRLAEIQGMTFLWDDVFPQYAHNHKHWTVLCSHYAVALNREQRFADVIDRFVTRWSTPEDASSTAASASESPRDLIFSAAIAESVFLACSHERDAETALRVHRVARQRKLALPSSAYFHLLNTLLRVDGAAYFDDIVGLCEELVNEPYDPPGPSRRRPRSRSHSHSHSSPEPVAHSATHRAVPISLWPRILALAAERDELQRVMPLYSHPPTAPMDPSTEYHFDVALLTLWRVGRVEELFVVLEGVLESPRASREMKTRVCKALLRKVLDDALAGGAALDTTERLLALMQRHALPMSHKAMAPMLAALLQREDVVSLGDCRAWFQRFPKVMRWNSFAVCELALACVRFERRALVDELLHHALDHDIPIKYAALESVIAMYYRCGNRRSLENVSAIIRALRLNKHMPLGLSVTEMGMMCNVKLGRPQEAVHLLEDFVAGDGDRKRILSRRPMLVAAKEAYGALRRHDEANAMRMLIKRLDDGLLNWSADALSTDDDADADGEGQDQEQDTTEACDERRTRVGGGAAGSDDEDLWRQLTARLLPSDRMQ
ncbi:hypothetical protein P43SY_011166 [Pythium insidiosum]|uniref:Uncharacterized protein n=1 Tax=Pythium insidiosum TaxID=114742 RepID=A0AAD5LTI1_PYTIN|nr:hypothetical protein P43SY_011166 [Pythium insidiosum]